MIDINSQLRASYYSLLSGNVKVNNNAVPVYYAQTPAGVVSDIYILINAISSTGYNDDVTQYKRATITFLIVTKILANNDGSAADSIANQLYKICDPSSPAQVIQITNGQVITTTERNDIVMAGLTDGEKRVINRAITFEHLIAIEEGTGFGGNIYYGYQDNDGAPTDFSHYFTTDPNQPISIDFGSTFSPEYFWMAQPVSGNIKTVWADLNNLQNTGSIGEPDMFVNLFAYTEITISGSPYRLYMTQYATKFEGAFNAVKFS